MKSSARLAVLLFTLLAAFSLVSVAAAHTLKVPRAAKANRTFAKLVCSATNDPEGICVASRPGGCKRISQHRVRCVFFLAVEAEDKSRARCRGLIDWTIRNRSSALRPNFLGFKSCAQVRGPQVEPEPLG
jgi:hypothetical protein